MPPFNYQNVRRAWELAHPYVRQYSPQLFDFGRRFIGSAVFPIAFQTVSNILGDYQGTKDYLPDLFEAKDAKYIGFSEGDPGPETKRRRLDSAVRGAVPPPEQSNASNAIQSASHPQNQAGSNPDVNMVRRVGFRRFSRRRNPGFTSRRIFRTWTGQSVLRRRRRGWNKPELKYKDMWETGNTPPLITFWSGITQATNGGTAGNAICLNEMYTQTTGNARIGIDILMKSILIRACIQTKSSEEPDPPVSSLTSVAECVRVMVVLDRQANGSVPALTDLFGSVTGLNPGANAVTYPMNLTYKSRFKVLCDRHYVLSSQTNAAEFYFEFYKKKNIRVHYTGTSATVSTIADIRSNALWFFCFGNGASLGNASNRPHLQQFMSRIRFIDP